MRKPFNGTFPITQIFGVNPSSYAQFGMKGHNGIDYATPTGTPIVAPHGGKIIEAAFDATGYGMYVKIENDVEGSVLGHLQSFNVNPGDTILEGQQIGISDNTGNSTGPHLHWGYYRMPRDRTNGYAGFIDQAPYLVSTPIPDTALSECLKLHADVLKQLETQKKANSDLLIVNGKKDSEINSLKSDKDSLSKQLLDSKQALKELQGIHDTFVALSSNDCQREKKEIEVKCAITIANYKSKLKNTNKGLLVLILDKLGL